MRGEFGKLDIFGEDTNSASDRNLLTLISHDLPTVEALATDLPVLIRKRLDCLCDNSDEREGLLSLWLEEANDFVDRLVELMQLFAVKGFTESVRSDYVRLWFLLHSGGILIKSLKYTVNVAFLRHQYERGSPLLEMPDKSRYDLGLDLFPKSFRIALGRLRGSNVWMKRKNQFLINSLFQGWKKGLLPLDLLAYDANMGDVKKRLCHTDGECSEELLDDVTRISEDLLQKFKFISKEKEVLLPSSSATIEYSRSRFGGMGLLLDDWYGRSVDELKDLSTRALQFDHLACFVRCKESCDVKELRSIGPTCGEIKEIEMSLLRDSLFDFKAVRPYGVFEPMKIRPITRPSIRQHFGLRGLQKQLLRFLNRFECFKITGDSNKDHLNSHVNRVVMTTSYTETLQMGNGDENDYVSSNRIDLPWIISGDYSAATDCLKRAVTEAIWNVIGRTIPWWMYQKGLDSLTKNNILFDEKAYPKPTGLYKNIQFETMESSPLPQTNGQLMGNILSFPILCIANYAAYHLSIERLRGEQIRVCSVMSEHPVQINGDDILFRSNEEHYPLWRSTVADFGFKLSLGKNFCHESMFQINSQLFRISHDIFGELCGSERVPYFNFGQLTGRKKGMDSQQCLQGKSFEESLNELPSLGSSFTEIRNSIEFCKSRSLRDAGEVLLEKWYTRRYESVLNKDLFLLGGCPQQYGGLGFWQGAPKSMFAKKDQLRSMITKSISYPDTRQYAPECMAVSFVSAEPLLRVNKPRRLRYQTGDSGFVLIPDLEVLEERTMLTDSRVRRVNLEW